MGFILMQSSFMDTSCSLSSSIKLSELSKNLQSVELKSVQIKHNTKGLNVLIFKKQYASSYYI